MPSNLSENYHSLAFLEWEEDFNVSRANITLADGENLPAGRVIGQITATGKWVSSPATGTDGSEVARGILAYATDATDGDVACVAIVKLAVANHNIINYDATVDDAAKKAAKHAELAAVTIDVR